MSARSCLFCLSHSCPFSISVSSSWMWSVSRFLLSVISLSVRSYCSFSMASISALRCICCICVWSPFFSAMSVVFWLRSASTPSSAWARLACASVRAVWSSPSSASDAATRARSVVSSFEICCEADDASYCASWAVICCFCAESDATCSRRALFSSTEADAERFAALSSWIFLS
eukprot:Amastigsp_a508773_134.p2 type:complete len:174 gc:universal Amastigsp_a508773_134:165-686(+)